VYHVYSFLGIADWGDGREGTKGAFD